MNIPTKVEPYPSMASVPAIFPYYEMMWGYTMFPASGFSSKPDYISRIEDKNGNVLATIRHRTKRSDQSSHSIYHGRMMQGPVDIGTAADYGKG